jgi:hypothetical protein
MDNQTKRFRNHLYSKVYQYIVSQDYFHEYLQSAEGQYYDTDEFYASAIPELLRSLKDNYEIEKHYPKAIPSIRPEERYTIQRFMAWFNMHQNDGFREVYSGFAYDQSYDLEPLIELMKQVKEKEFEYDETTDAPSTDDALEHVFRLIDRFTSAAASVLIRRKNKPELILEDEYDMQDLLLVMLRAYFPSVKSEQVTEGNSDRHFLKIDFLVPDTKIAIECKFNDGGSVKTLTDQLDIDIQSYHRHPDCRYLIFFVYDKSLSLPDPNGLERKYEQQQTFDGKEMDIFLKIRPKN